MKTNNMKLVFSFITLVAFLCLVGTVTAEENYELKYQEKVKQNDGTIGVIAGVINYVCPKLVPASTNICNPDDPVGSAVGVQKYMEQNWDKEEDDIEDAEMPELLNKKAALQFWDAVEQFKQHYPWREKAKKAAGQDDWYNSFLNEEMAWQYLVKCASRGIFAKKIVDGE
ncbi:hypothetical protein D1BOALGB6SA_2741 [Olavius sp. associated proteobacterium Delta 1]|nr:hypothetical protein D1BOALGB6SA_2741 [Olavius sp. associated proteobacterium Delta 1]